MLFSPPAHESGPGDPALLGWIKDQLDALIHLEPLVIVVMLGLLIFAIPAVILAVYARERSRRTTR